VQRALEAAHPAPATASPPVLINANLVGELSPPSLDAGSTTSFTRSTTLSEGILIVASSGRRRPGACCAVALPSMQTTEAVAALACSFPGSPLHSR